MSSSSIRSIAVTLAILSAALPSQGPTVAERLPNGEMRLAAAEETGAALAPISGFGAITFLDVRWTTPSESWTPRTDIPRESDVEGLSRLVLADESRVYRILTSAGTAFLLVDDDGARVLGQLPGDGLTSGFGSELAASTNGPVLAFATIEAPNESPRVFTAPIANTGKRFVDVSPAGGVPGLQPSSLTLAQDALFFTDDSTLWRHDLISGATLPVPIPAAIQWIDHEIAVSGDEMTIGLRAGTSATMNRMVTVTADGLTAIVYGTEAHNLPINYTDPANRPGYSLSYDGTLLPHFQRSNSHIKTLVAENFDTHQDCLLGQMNRSALIGVESEIALGDDPLGLAPGGITLFLPVPQFGNMVAALPYQFLMLALETNMYGSGLFQSLSQLNGLSPYPPGQAPTLTVAGQFTAATTSDRFFFMGPQGVDRDILRISTGAPFGEILFQGLGQVHESVQVGSMVVIRAETSSTPGAPSALFVVDLSNGLTFDSSSLPGGSVTGASGSPDHTRIAWTRTGGSTSGEDLWLYDAIAGSAMMFSDVRSAAGLQWRLGGDLLVATGGTLTALHLTAPPEVIGTSTLPFTIL